MKNISFLLLLLVGGWAVSLSMPAWADSPKDAGDPVEVVIQGKQYKSIHAYKREQIKKTLKRALSSYDLREFEEDELQEIMREIRQHQEGDFSSPEEPETVRPSSLRDRPARRKVTEKDGEDSVGQMQEMLDQYNREHESAKDLKLDPGKVKSIIIKP